MKKIPFISIICTLVTLSTLIGCTGKSAQTTSSTVSANIETPTEITYYDPSRELKDSYTFKEATSKFAFPVSDTNLIFSDNGETGFNLQFHYDENNKIVGDISFYESGYLPNSDNLILRETAYSSLNDFSDAFLAGNAELTSALFNPTYKDFELIESTDEYMVFKNISETSSSSSSNLYFAKMIGDRVYYLVLSYFSEEQSLSDFIFVSEGAFICLDVDDGKEPFIFDKISNVPLPGNRHFVNTVDFTYTTDYISLYAVDSTDRIPVVVHYNNTAFAHTPSKTSFEVNDDAGEYMIGLGMQTKISKLKDIDELFELLEKSGYIFKK